MKELSTTVAGSPVTVYVVENHEDLEAFRDFVRDNLRCLAADTETTGLNTYAPDFRIRLVQFGTPDTSYVIPVEYGGEYAEDAIKALRGVQRLVFHNSSFDLPAIERKLDIPLEELWPKVYDTKLVSHIVDPREIKDGGPGHGLEDLTRAFIDADIADNVKGLMSKIAKEYKTTKSKIYPIIDIDHPEYLLYAGMDTILTARIASYLSRRIPKQSQQSGLVEWEHKITEVCSYMERTGFLLDVDYTQELSDKLRQDEEYYKGIAQSYGVEKVNSTEQVADVLESQGVRITGRTPTGKRQVNDDLLSSLASKGNTLADAVLNAKGVSKKRTSWVDKFLSMRDENDRCHANINSLQARTARMSITGIPAQTLPSDNWTIRRCFLADEGHVPAAIDYKTQELRVLAALSGDKNMRKVFSSGEDLHYTTAVAAFGDHIEAKGPERDYGKRGNFLKVYGGGARKLSDSIGIPLDTAKAVVKAFDSSYPGVGRYSKKLQQEGERNGYVVTQTGRVLPVDPDRSYSALNYVVQSTGRDVTCRALLRLHEAGFTPYLRLPIHDEIVASIPASHADWGSNEIGRLMSETMNGVFIGTEPKYGVRSWGSFYGSEY